MRRTTGERGQTSTEYVGVLLVVVAVLAVVLSPASGIADAISTAVEQQVCAIAQEDGDCEPTEGERAERQRGAQGLPGDRDADGIGDEEETRRGTNPNTADVDADGVGDGEEIRRGTNPNVAEGRGDRTGAAGPQDAVAASLAEARRLREREVFGRRGAVVSSQTGRDADRDGVPDVDDPVPGEHDVDRDGLSDAEEVALGSGPRASDTDRDGVRDQDEYERGTDPTRGVAPLTDDNRAEPWKRVGMIEDEWRRFEEAVLEEVNPGGFVGFLNGPVATGVDLDENGELELMEVRQNSVGSGFVRVISRLVAGGGGRVLSAGQAAARAASRVPASVRAPLARLGVLPGAARVARPPAPPGRPGVALGALDDLGRPIGASATITRRMLGTGTRATRTPPGYGPNAGLARGHLIARQLGGTGRDVRNLVTLYQRPANTPAMLRFENQVRAAVRGGEKVRYTVTPIYRGAEAVPRAVTLSARGSRGFRLAVSVLNKAG